MRGGVQNGVHVRATIQDMQSRITPYAHHAAKQYHQGTGFFHGSEKHSEFLSKIKDTVKQRLIIITSWLLRMSSITCFHQRRSSTIKYTSTGECTSPAISRSASSSIGCIKLLSTSGSYLHLGLTKDFWISKFLS